MRSVKAKLGLLAGIVTGLTAFVGLLATNYEQYLNDHYSYYSRYRPDNGGWVFFTVGIILSVALWVAAWLVPNKKEETS